MDFSKSRTRWASLTILVALCLTWAAVAANICDPTTGTNCQKINSAGSSDSVRGKPTRATYLASASGLAAATAHTLSIESPAGNTIRLTKWCIGLSNATAAVSVAVSINRRTTASSGGTALVAEGTGASTVSKMDPADGSFAGVGRIDGTLGTIGATIDQQNIQVGIIATGAGSVTPYCYEYGTEGDKVPILAAGVANGLTIAVPTLGAGSLATSISAVFIVE